MFTRQQTFEASCLPLVEQGEPARGETGCRYLTQDGRRCAAGHLMSTTDPEVLLYLGGGVFEADVDEHLTGHDLELVTALQAAHDAMSYRVTHPMSEYRWTLEQWCTDWLARVLRVAWDFGLDPTRVLDAARAKGWTIPEGVS